MSKVQAPQTYATKKATVNLLGDADAFKSALLELREAIGSSELDVSKDVLAELLSGPEFINKLFTVDSDISPADAVEVVVRLKPTDFFAGFLAAVSAGNIDRYII